MVVWHAYQDWLYIAQGVRVEERHLQALVLQLNDL